MKRNYTGMVASVALLVSGSSLAADETARLAEMSSPVMVNQGGTYIPATAGMALRSGDQLMVLQGGEALVNYATGCEVKLGGNEILQIAATDACSSPGIAAVNAQLAPTATSGGGSSAAITTAEIIALVGVGSAAAYLVTEFNDDDSDNAELPPISR